MVVEGYYGTKNGQQTLDLAEVDLAVCTIEKANSIINRLMVEGQLHELGMVVADEIHMLTEASRG